MARLRIQHCIVNLTTRQYGVHPTSDLLGVDYYYTVPADTEFPTYPRKFELFVRFIASSRIGGSVRVTISFLNYDGSDRQIIYKKRFGVPSATAARFLVVDQGFKMLNVSLPGEGTYAVRVSKQFRKPWEAKTRWILLATDYFLVEKA